ncbi:MAG: AtpZ/AtpI family protein [Eubacteriales bacterium]|nr:AtpZ/AtpI family protein [Eubacteriales bacterium]
MKQWTEIFKNITMLGQFGLSFIMPTLMCILLCWWLNAKVGVGAWVYIPGFILGMGSSFMVAYKFYRAVMQREKKEKNKKGISFNDHI